MRIYSVLDLFSRSKQAAEEINDYIIEPHIAKGDLFVLKLENG
jgi:hypothetical protein